MQWVERIYPLIHHLGDLGEKKPGKQENVIISCFYLFETLTDRKWFSQRKKSVGNSDSSETDLSGPDVENFPADNNVYVNAE